MTVSESTNVKTQTLSRAATIGWSGFALSLLIVFSILKLPNYKIQAWISAKTQEALAPMGYQIQSETAQLSFLFGLSYELKQAKISSLYEQGEPLLVDRVKISPKILSLLIGRMGANVLLEKGDGFIDLDVSMVPDSFTNPFSGVGKVMIGFDAKEFDLGKSRAFSFLTKLRGSSILQSGSGDISFSTAAPMQLDGELKLDIRKTKIDAQQVVILSIPEIAISEIKGELKMERGKVLIQSFKVGKAAPSSSPQDDIGATVTGSIQLGRTMDQSTLDLKTKFAFSEKIKSSFALLDALLSVGKQPDGSFACKFTGAVYGAACGPY